MSDAASTPNVANNTPGFRMVRILGAVAMLSGLLSLAFMGFAGLGA